MKRRNSAPSRHHGRVRPAVAGKHGVRRRCCTSAMTGSWPSWRRRCQRVEDGENACLQQRSDNRRVRAAKKASSRSRSEVRRTREQVSEVVVGGEPCERSPPVAAGGCRHPRTSWQSYGRSGAQDLCRSGDREDCGGVAGVRDLSQRDHRLLWDRCRPVGAKVSGAVLVNPQPW